MITEMVAHPDLWIRVDIDHGDLRSERKLLTEAFGALSGDPRQRESVSIEFVSRTVRPLCTTNLPIVGRI